MPETLQMSGSLGPGILHEADGAEVFFGFFRQRQVVHPIEQQRSGLGYHPVRQLPSEAVAFDKEFEVTGDEVFSVVAERPIKPIFPGQGIYGSQGLSDL